MFSAGGDDAESSSETQEISALLQSSRDLFVQFAGFQFGAAFYKMRGYAGENQVIMINGIAMSNPETNLATWSSWGGLNDVTRLVETRFGTTANRYGFSGAGGYTHMDSRASSFKKTTRFSYAVSNRVYRHRVMFTHSSGLNRKGWALSLSFSNRNGNEVYVPGTYFMANAFYLSLDKKLNAKHLFSFTGFAAPSEQGRAKAATLETYRLSNSHYYNSNWGYQNGKVRNASVSRSQQPLVMFAHVYTPKKETRLVSTIYQRFGQTSRTAINSFKAPIAQADYYKKLPSYYFLRGDTLNGGRMAAMWAQPEFGQIDWDAMIAMNKANLYSDPNTLGQMVNTTETRARYILERQVETIRQSGFSSVLNTRIKKTFLSAGLNCFAWNSRKYKEVEDLLGATFWLDVDQFAEGLGVEDYIQQNDIDKPNRKVRSGERFGYDYALKIKKADAWTQLEHSYGRTEVFISASSSFASLWREGFVANGKFPNNSKGLGPKNNFFNYGIRGGITYKISGRNYLSANGLMQTRMPEAGNIFISPRVRQDVVNDPVNEKIFSADINYILKAPSLKVRFTVYHTQIKDQLWLRTYWSDEFNNSVNLLMKNLDQKQEGAEIGIEKIIQTVHSLQFAAGYGMFVYSSRPLLSAWQDNNNTSLYQDRVVYLKNFRIGGSPQTVIGSGYKYTGRKNWFAGIYFNYIGNRYVEPNPDRRTTESIGKFQEDERDIAGAFLEQEKLPSFTLLNANAGKSLRLKRKYFLNMNLSVNNLLNRKNILLSGTESLRWNPASPELFANKYYYLPGTTWMFILTLNF